MCSKAIHHAGIKKVFVISGKYSNNAVKYLLEHRVEVSLIDGNKVHDAYISNGNVMKSEINIIEI